jgi:peptide/nickel transport system ATP-binding protein
LDRDLDSVFSLEVRDLSVDYLGEDGTPLHAVEGVSFALAQGRSLGLVGESGCGKTTVMLSLLRLLPEAGRIVNGQVLFGGQDLLQYDEAQMREVRWHYISMVFQGAMNALNPVRTIESQIVEALRLHGVAESSRAARQRAGELLSLVGIAPDRATQYPHQYSGGMRQRAVIAMALACNPRVLIADEPTTALDVMIQAQILELLQNLQEELHLSVIFVTHDLGLVAEVCDDVMVMYGGKAMEYADCDAIFNEPRHPYTQRLLQAFPDIERPGSALASIPGNPPRLDDLPPGCRFEPRCHRREAICAAQVPPNVRIAPGHTAACHFVYDMPIIGSDSPSEQEAQSSPGSGWTS